MSLSSLALMSFRIFSNISGFCGVYFFFNARKVALVKSKKEREKEKNRQTGDKQKQKQANGREGGKRARSERIKRR